MRTLILVAAIFAAVVPPVVADDCSDSYTSTSAATATVARDRFQCDFGSTWLGFWSLDAQEAATGASASATLYYQHDDADAELGTPQYDYVSADTSAGSVFYERKCHDATHGTGRVGAVLIASTTLLCQTDPLTDEARTVVGVLP
ncbi:MAG TPA: hypothetical protein VI997_02300 [Candidatus Thermoplasmatota archaeon]|nr:hypothetical protein [Candidatus Thermoplasmatota archaeon]